MNYSDIFSMDVFELCGWVTKEFEIPNLLNINSLDDLQKANQINLQLASYESYFLTLLSYAEILVRHAKRNLSKREYEDMIDRRKILQNCYDNFRHQREAISRSVTIYLKSIDELKMLNQL